MVEQMIFREMKLVDGSGNFDDKKIKGFIDATITDSSWNKIINAGYLKCTKEVPKYAEFFQTHSKIPKETCDFKYEVLRGCIDIASFGVS
jgi:hypothetical protein